MVGDQQTVCNPIYTYIVMHAWTIKIDSKEYGIQNDTLQTTPRFQQMQMILIGPNINRLPKPDRGNSNFNRKRFAVVIY